MYANEDIRKLKYTNSVDLELTINSSMHHSLYFTLIINPDRSITDRFDESKNEIRTFQSIRKICHKFESTQAHNFVEIQSIHNLASSNRLFRTIPRCQGPRSISWIITQIMM